MRIPYISLLDNWKSELHDISLEGLFNAQKIAPAPSAESLRRAEADLRQRRMVPVELISRLVGPNARRILAGLLPHRLVRKLAEGRSQ